MCVFGASSSDIAKSYIDEAYELGRLLAAQGTALVFGGGSTGLMGAVARGVTELGGRAVGVIPEKLNQPGIAYPHCAELIITADMHARKATMEKLSDAYIALPGGIGTLEELLEVLTLNQLAYISAPVVILNTGGYYDALLKQLDVFVEQGFMNGAYRGMYAVADTAAQAAELLSNFSCPELPNKIKEALKQDE